MGNFCGKRAKGTPIASRRPRQESRYKREYGGKGRISVTELSFNVLEAPGSPRVSPRRGVAGVIECGVGR